MNVSFYTKAQLQAEVRLLKANVTKTLRKQLGKNPQGLMFGMWMIGVSNNGVRLCIQWHCDNLNGTESITL